MEGATNMISGVHHIGLTVSSLRRSIDFYSLLGLELVTQPAEIYGTVAERVVGLAGARFDAAILRTPKGDYLELLEYHNPPGKQLRFEPCDPAGSHLAFLVDDIGEAFRHLSAIGVMFNSEPQEVLDGPSQGMKFVYARDPDGAIVEFVERPNNGVDGMLGTRP